MIINLPTEMSIGIVARLHYFFTILILHRPLEALRSSFL